MSGQIHYLGTIHKSYLHMMMNFETVKNVFSMPINEISRRIKIRKRELVVYGGIEFAIKVDGEGDFKAVSNHRILC